MLTDRALQRAGIHLARIHVHLHPLWRGLRRPDRRRPKLHRESSTSPHYHLHSIPSLIYASLVRGNGCTPQLRPLRRRRSALAHDRVVPESAGAVAGEDHGRRGEGRAGGMGRRVFVLDRLEVRSCSGIIPRGILIEQQNRTVSAALDRQHRRAAPRNQPAPVLVGLLHRDRARVRDPYHHRVRTRLDDERRGFPYLESPERAGSAGDRCGGYDSDGAQVGPYSC